MYAEFFSQLPFQWAEYTFMQNALLGVLLIAPLFSMLGTMVVDSKMSFFSDSLGHSALTGIGIGVLLGLPSKRAATIIFGVLFAVLLIFIKSRGKASTDTTIGVFSSSAVALGIVILSSGGGFSKYSAFLTGDILAIQPRDLLLQVAVLLLTVLYWIFAYNRLLLTALCPDVAKSRGINTFALELSFAVVVAAAVMTSIQWVGVLIINAMLILPAAAARNVARNSRSYHLLALVFCLFCGISGLIASFSLDTSAGATIVLFLAGVYALTLLFSRR